MPFCDLVIGCKYLAEKYQLKKSIKYSSAIFSATAELVH